MEQAYKTLLLSAHMNFMMRIYLHFLHPFAQFVSKKIFAAKAS